MSNNLMSTNDFIPVTKEWISRNYKDYSQCAKELGIDNTALSHYLHGRRKAPEILVKAMGYIEVKPNHGTFYIKSKRQ